MFVYVSSKQKSKKKKSKERSTWLRLVCNNCYVTITGVYACMHACICMYVRLFEHKKYKNMQKYARDY